MLENYLIVHKSILPDYYETVLAVRRRLESGQGKDVSQACREAGISRSTYYKYKDYIFRPSEDDSSRKAVISMMLRHEAGVLGSVLGLIAGHGGNVLTILQNPPIAGRASVVICVDMEKMDPLPDVLSALSSMKGVENPALLDIS